jgi:hypothetical protein
MPCLECGNPKTCRAHILPAALGKDIIKQESGLKALSLLVPNRIDNTIQSSLFDENILCSDCDGRLNLFDDHAIEIIRLLGTAHEAITSQANSFTVTRISGINHEQLALFAAAVVWRTSVSKYRELSEFTLGNNEAWFRDMIFRRSTDIPTVLAARLVDRSAIPDETAAGALQYPVRVRLRGVSAARFVVRGLIFLVQTTRAVNPTLHAGAITTFGRSAGPTCLTGLLFPFDQVADSANIWKSKYMQHLLARRS